MRGVLCEVRVRESEQLDDARVGDSVVDGAVLPARLDEPAPAQAGEVVRHLRLREPEPFDELPDRQLALVAEKLEDPQPDRVAEAAEVLGDEIGADRASGRRNGETGLITQLPYQNIQILGP